MKKIITILLLSLMAIVSCGQSLMLTMRKADVMSEMSWYKEWHRTVNAKDYLEYQKDSVAIGYRFTDHLCSEAYITMTLPAMRTFIEDKEDCGCWRSLTEHSWLYQTNVFDKLVKVTRVQDSTSATFIYKFTDYE